MPGRGIARVAFAAAPFLLLALLAGAMISYNIEILGVALQPPVLIAILVGNVVAYGYRIVAAVDAYRVVRYLNRVSEGGAGRLGPARATLAPISAGGPPRRSSSSWAAPTQRSPTTTSRP